MQTRRRALRADVFLQESDLIRRNKELVVAPVLYVQIVAVHARHLERLHAEVFADAVRDMHHVVAGRDLAEMPDALARTDAPAQLCLVPAEDVLFGEHDNICAGQLKSCAQRAARHRDLPRCRRGVTPQDARRQFPPRKHIAHEIRPLAAAREDEHARLLREVAAQLALEEGKLPSERRHRHHLERNESARRASGQLAAHQR